MISYHLNEETLLYTGVSTGFKSTLLDNRLRLNSEAFYNDYTDKQLSVITLVGADLESTTSNVGELTTQGAELEMTWMPAIEGVVRESLADVFLAMEESYGSTDAFIEQGLGIDSDTRERLKSLLLE